MYENPKHTAACNVLIQKGNMSPPEVIKLDPELCTPKQGDTMAGAGHCLCLHLFKTVPSICKFIITQQLGRCSCRELLITLNLIHLMLCLLTLLLSSDFNL